VCYSRLSSTNARHQLRSVVRLQLQPLRTGCLVVLSVMLSRVTRLAPLIAAFKDPVIKA